MEQFYLDWKFVVNKLSVIFIVNNYVIGLQKIGVMQLGEEEFVVREGYGIWFDYLLCVDEAIFLYEEQFSREGWVKLGRVLESQ